MPIIEVSFWKPSKPYLADPSIIDAPTDFLKAVDGCTDVYTGFAEEENIHFAFLVWETLEHHKALMSHPQYPKFIGLGPTIAPKAEGGTGITVYHVEFNKPFTPSHSAPTTEVLAITLKEGKTKEDLWKVLDAISAKIDAENPKYAPVTWGQTLEDERLFYMTIGWDSSDAHRRIIGGTSFLPFVTDLRATAAMKMLHYPVLSPLIAKYPRAASSLFQTYNDIVYAQQWHDVEVIDLESCSRGAIRGKKRDTEEVLRVVPCSLSETLSFAWLQDAFSQLFPKEIVDEGAPSAAAANNNSTSETSPPFLYLAITTQDASIVYYKLSQGIVKPPV